jgi:hypothetical protein
MRLVSYPRLTKETEMNVSKNQPEPQTEPNGKVVQSEELTQEVFREEDQVNDGVGPQPDGRRGNAQGGFTYEGLDPEEADPKKEKR